MIFFLNLNFNYNISFTSFLSKNRHIYYKVDNVVLGLLQELKEDLQKWIHTWKGAFLSSDVAVSWYNVLQLQELKYPARSHVTLTQVLFISTTFRLGACEVFPIQWRESDKYGCCNDVDISLMHVVHIWMINYDLAIKYSTDMVKYSMAGIQSKIK